MRANRKKDSAGALVPHHPRRNHPEGVFTNGWLVPPPELLIQEVCAGDPEFILLTSSQVLPELPHHQPHVETPPPTLEPCPSNSALWIPSARRLGGLLDIDLGGLLARGPRSGFGWDEMAPSCLTVPGQTDPSCVKVRP